MLNLNDFAKEVHAVSVEHGWWEVEENNDAETKLALIHAEWSEALEEYRANRLMVWFNCVNSGEPCMQEGCGDWEDGCCALNELGKKPEGIAIELTDGVIRILDLMAHEGMEFTEVNDLRGKRCRLPRLVTLLHFCASAADNHIDAHGDWIDEEMDEAAHWLSSCIVAVRNWLKEQGEDLGELLRMKHEYNKTRSYRHGGKRC